MLQTERETVIRLRTDEAIDEQAFRRIQRDIDLAEERLRGLQLSPLFSVSDFQLSKGAVFEAMKAPASPVNPSGSDYD